MTTRELISLILWVIAGGFAFGTLVESALYLSYSSKGWRENASRVSDNALALLIFCALLTIAGILVRWV